MELIAVVAVIFLIAVQLAWVTRIDLAYLFAPAIFFISGWGFIFGLLGYLNLAMETLVLSVGLILIILLVKSNGFRSQLLKSSYAPSTVAFVSLSLISLYKSKDWMLSQWDEFTHWGVVVKAMYEYSALGPATPVDFMSPRYPPGISLFQYFVMDFSAGWREGLLFWATHLIVISIIVTVLAKSSYKFLSEIVMKLFIALVASSAFFNNFDNIYADPVLALSFGFLLFVAIQASRLEGKWAIVLALTAGFVTMIKPIGIYFAVSAILINIVASLFAIKVESARRKLFAFVPATIALVSVGTAWLAWSQYLLSYGSSDGGLVSGNLPSNFGTGKNTQQISSDFLFAFFNSNLRPSYSVPMSPLYWTIVCGALFAIWIRFSNEIDRVKNIAIGISLLITSVGYFSMILYSYLTVFGPGEAAGLASYERYIGTWFQGVFFAIVILILNEFSLRNFFESARTSEAMGVKARRQVALLLIVIIGVTTLSSIHSYMLMLRVSSTQGNDARKPFIPVIEAIAKANIPTESMVYIIANHTVGFEYHVLRYEMTGMKFGQVPWSIGSKFGDGDVWTDPAWDVERWSDELREFDYVVLYSTTESFNGEFGSLFESGNAEPNSVYRITKTSDGISLSKVN